MLCANYMRIQQEFLLEKIETLTSDILKPTNRLAKNRISSTMVWQRFTDINTEIFLFFDQLRAVNRVWSPYVSVYFVGHTMIEVYLFYGIIFDSGTFDLLKRSYFLYFNVEFMLVLYAITHACAVVVRRNIRIWKTNVTFCYAFSRTYQPNPIYLIKVFVT